jgi:predicted metal-binding protein
LSVERSSTSVRRHKTKWRDVVLVCRKCTKKVRGGFGAKGRQSLRNALREELNLPKGRRSPIAVVEVGCFGICPKKAVTVFSSAHPGALQAIKPKTPVSDAAEALGLRREEAVAIEAALSEPAAPQSVSG